MKIYRALFTAAAMLITSGLATDARAANVYEAMWDRYIAHSSPFYVKCSVEIFGESHPKEAIEEWMRWDHLDSQFLMEEYFDLYLDYKTKSRMSSRDAYKKVVEVIEKIDVDSYPCTEEEE